MIPTSLSQVPFIGDMARMAVAAEHVNRFSGLPRGTVRGVVKDVNDPEERGRVRVLFDAFSPDIPTNAGAEGEFAGERAVTEPELSHWIDVSPSFKGKQPAGLIGTRVSIVTSDGDYKYAVLGDTLYDPERLTETAASKLKQPRNSSMTRLPIYSAGSLPPACKENHGCIVIEEGGPMNSDWTCVCLKRNGKYIWVRHVDLQHGHAGEDDGSQNPDSHGDSEAPVKESSVWDYVFPTSDSEMPKSSAFGQSPRPNPYGGSATWHAPPS